MQRTYPKLPRNHVPWSVFMIFFIPLSLSTYNFFSHSVTGDTYMTEFRAQIIKNKYVDLLVIAA